MPLASASVGSQPARISRAIHLSTQMGSGHFPLDIFPRMYSPWTFPSSGQFPSLLHGVKHSPFYHHHSPIYNIKLSTVYVYKIDSGRSVRVRIQYGLVPVFVGWIGQQYRLMPFFTARRVYIARTMPWQDVCPSVCLSHAGIKCKW